MKLRFSLKKCFLFCPLKQALLIYLIIFELISIGQASIGIRKPEQKIVSTNQQIVDATASDYTIVPRNTTGDITVTIPDPSTCQGRIYVVKHDGNAANDIILDPVADYKIVGAEKFTLNAAWEHVTIQSVGTTWLIIGGKY